MSISICISLSIYVYIYICMYVCMYVCSVLTFPAQLVEEKSGNTNIYHQKWEVPIFSSSSHLLHYKKLLETFQDATLSSSKRRALPGQRAIWGP